MTDQAVDDEITVVLCTYNGARYVEEQLASILNQSVLPVSVVISDDGSTDGTVDLIEQQFAARDRGGPSLLMLPRSAERLGAARNFERAIASAHTPFVALSDQDDVWRRDRIERSLDVLRSQQDLWLVASNTSFIDGRGRAIPGDSFTRFGFVHADPEHLAPERLLSVLIRRNFVQGMTFTLRRDLITAASGGADHFLHDYWLAINAAARGRMALIDDDLVSYRLHGSNVVGVGERRAVRRLLKRVHWFVTKPRTGVARRLLEWNEVADRLLKADGIPPALFRVVEQKIRFERSRSRGSRTFLQQVAEVVRLARRGDYARFDRDGLRAAIDDLLWRRSL